MSEIIVEMKDYLKIKGGKYIRDLVRCMVFWQCDQCLEQYTGRTKRIPNFCPNCGADMRKDEEHDE